ncbi:ATP-binding protein [Butyrivibrio proteoclasticus]|uniref:ATP-binding protein n=1 Tax=Butyrivibrio proteoclasticus TaxID=43305 RepID=UPI000687C732|nr:ATP-binding protein [Butyrivibrio proteoclasticus]
MFNFFREIQLDLMLVLAGSCGVLVILALFTKTITRRRKHAMVFLELGAMFLLLFDRLAYMYRGDTSITGYHMVRISNFMVYFLSLFIIHSFTIYLMDLIITCNGVHKIPPTLVACEILFTLGEIMIIINAFTNIYYHFDEFNRYTRNSGIIISYIFPIAVGLLQIYNIIHYKKKLGQSTFMLMLLFSILPMLATFAQFYAYGLSLSNITLVGMCVLLYVFEIINMNKLEAAKAAAEKASNAKSRFLANMSHEIRTPINTIMGMNEMILRENPEGVPKPYFLSVINYAMDIRFASESLLSIINDILDISKIESGKMHLVEQEYDLSELLQGLVTMIRIRSNEKDLYFNLDIDENIPQRLYGDVGKIKQIVLNLLTNAVKYTEEGGFTLTVKAGSITDDTCSLYFSVKDTGIGVKEEDIEKLFTAFERVDEQRNSSIQGTGLGLSISNQFAALLGGSLTCHSVYGEGSDFIFTVDQKIVDSTPIGEFTERRDNLMLVGFAPRFTAPEASVLVVDDNTMNLSVIAGFLRTSKVKVSLVTSGTECLEILSENHFDLILLDHMMPVMDGIETLKKIRETGNTVPVVALTANYIPNGEAYYGKRGFDGYIPKPVDSKVLDDVLLNLLPKELINEEFNPAFGPHMEEFPKDLAWIEEIEELDIDEGIKNNGSIEIFITSLHLFLDTIDDNAKVIIDAYDSGDINLYTIKVHSLKSSAKIIGATKLSQMAQALENAGKKNDTEFIKANHTRFISHYYSFKDTLSRLSGTLSPIEEFMAKELSENEVKDAVSQLKEISKQLDYDEALIVMDKLKSGNLDDKTKTLVDDLEKALKKFDWDKVDEILDKYS